MDPVFIAYMQVSIHLCKESQFVQNSHFSSFALEGHIFVEMTNNYRLKRRAQNNEIFGGGQHGVGFALCIFADCTMRTD